MRYKALLVVAAMWLCLPALGAPGQTSSRRPTMPPPRSQTDRLEQIEREQQRQEREAARRKREQERAARFERREALRQLRADLPRLRQLLEQIQADLREIDVRTELNVNLRQRADELEKLAKRTRKNIRKL